MDFVALIARRPGRDILRDVETLEVISPPAVQDLAMVLRSMDYLFHGDARAAWIDETWDELIRLRVRPALPDLTVSLLLPEGFFLTFGTHVIRVYHTLRWITFLTDHTVRDATLDAVSSLCALFDTSDCIITSDHHEANRSFAADRRFDECLAVSDPVDGEVSTLADLYEEREDDSETALQPSGRIVTWPASKELPVGWRRPTIWDSKGYWRLRWEDERLAPRFSPVRRAEILALPPSPPRTPPPPEPQPTLDSIFPVSREGRYGFIDRAGQLIIPLQFLDAGGFVDGRASVKTPSGWRLIDTNGRVHDEPTEIRSARWEFPRGTCAPRLIPVRRRTGSSFAVCGFADAERLTLEIPAIYEDVGAFSEGRATVRTGGRWGFIDERGALIGEPRFTEARPYTAGRAAVRAADGKWGFVDLAGTLVIECTFDAVSDFRPDGVARVELRRRAGYIDLTGAYLWKPED